MRWSYDNSSRIYCFNLGGYVKVNIVFTISLTALSAIITMFFIFLSPLMLPSFPLLYYFFLLLLLSEWCFHFLYFLNICLILYFFNTLTVNHEIALEAASFYYDSDHELPHFSIVLPSRLYTEVYFIDFNVNKWNLASKAEMKNHIRNKIQTLEEKNILKI